MVHKYSYVHNCTHVQWRPLFNAHNKQYTVTQKTQNNSQCC